MTDQELSWEEAVRWYRAQPGNEDEVLNNYFDLPVLGAAERYANSEEFAEVLRLLGHGQGRKILDFGAGNGIASFALAKNGWIVTAFEPDPSAEVGAAAIAAIRDETGLPIEVIRESSDVLPFADQHFDAILARQVLHHVPDLDLMAREFFRILRPGSLCLTTRDHLADDERQLNEFRATHPLHHLYGGEHAYPLDRYLTAVEKPGFSILQCWGPVESILNFFPGTERERQLTVRQIANHSYFRFGRLLGWSKRFQATQLRRYTKNDSTPGRIFSLLLQRP
ncbi:MAG TPA: class I SAM-dependent methyltransferase [Pyrinomonadaceae bacterium]|nr:class I SAM-dependent methyltransferase [Pyrinomonadaceae bacterium]